MKVLVISEPGVDGVFRYVEALCHYLVRRGATVHLAYSDRRSSDRLDALVAFVGAQGGTALNLRTGNRPAWSDFRALWSLARFARRIRPDLVSAHSSKAGALGRLLPLFGVRAAQIYHPHAYVGMRPGQNRMNVLFNAVEAVLGRFGRTIACSPSEEAFARFVLRLPPARLSRLPHGVELGRFHPAAPAEKERLRARFGLPRRGPVLGFLGRSSAQKDPITLYRAFALARAREPDLVLFHVGRGELDDTLARLVEELGIGSAVFRLPYLPAPADFYRAVDGFILTSHYEGFSLAALEAVASDLPVILSDAPGNADLLAEPLSHAWRARPGQVEDFAQAIAAWARTVRVPRPSNHRALAEARFDSERQLAAVFELYRGWLPRPGSAPLRTCSPPP